MRKRLWYGFDMAQLEEAIKADGPAKRRSPIPTTPPHPIPGGEYDRDGFLYGLHVEEGLRHDRVRQETTVLLRPHLRRLHGENALVTGNCAFYARRSDRFRKPVAPDILVSLTAGDIDAPATPPDEDRKSYKLWQEPVPDLIMEIVSSSSVTRDTVEKPRLYESLGIPEFWLFDPSRHTDIPDGLRGWRLVDGRYRQVPPRAPGPDRAPVPAGVTAHWSGVLGLYLYSQGPDLLLHHPETGRLRDVFEESDARVAAEEARAAAEAARQEEEAARRDAEALAAHHATRVAALEAELQALKGKT